MIMYIIIVFVVVIVIFFIFMYFVELHASVSCREGCKLRPGA